MGRVYAHCFAQATSSTEPHYVFRKATSGSTFVALSAGMKLATTATINSNTETAIKVIGSEKIMKHISHHATPERFCNQSKLRPSAAQTRSMTPRSLVNLDPKSDPRITQLSDLLFVRSRVSRRIDRAQNHPASTHAGGQLGQILISI